MSTATVFSYSIGRKLVMGITGLFLVSFLFVHLGGNALLFIPDNGETFNAFVRFMTTNPLIKVLEWGLFAGFIVHIIYAAILTRQNAAARPTAYAFKGNQGKSANWFSRNMGLTGTIFLVFLLSHITMFWGAYKFGDSNGQATLEQAYTFSYKVKEDVIVPDGTVIVKSGHYIDFEELTLARNMGLSTKPVAIKNMTGIVADSFKQWWIVLLYVCAMVVLGLHLNHGFQSAFRSVGFVHSKYSGFLSKLGTGIAVVFPAVFALMPILYFLLPGTYSA
ncbi:MAG: succinate dehydrogenase cytochrome b subunit [Bacteroidia bacterium]|nr:succinate dehydrogenase cytochrome b subunit [Bacteroidia bacterium]